MSLGVDIRLLGDKELERALIRLAGKDQRAVVRKALRRALRPVLSSARAKVPVRTGTLKRSLKIRAGRGGRRAIVVRVQTGTRAELGIRSGSKHFYPAVVEFGSATLPARSYLRAALDENETSAKAVLKREIASGIGKVGRR